MVSENETALYASIPSLSIRDVQLRPRLENGFEKPRFLGLKSLQKIRAKM